MPRIQPQLTGSLNEQDRLLLAQLLVKAGYTVRLGKDKKPKSNNYIQFIEYRGDEAHGKDA